MLISNENLPSESVIPALNDNPLTRLLTVTVADDIGAPTEATPVTLEGDVTDVGPPPHPVKRLIIKKLFVTMLLFIIYFRMLNIGNN